MKKFTILLPLVMLSVTSCATVDKMNCLVNQSTQSIWDNVYTVQASTDAIRENAGLIDQSTRAIEENKEHLQKMAEH